MTKQEGQVVLLLILVMTVALAIGLSVIQRSLSDISTSTKVEESSRAFSAAEAGIEKALSSGGTSVNFSDIGASANVNIQANLPAPNQALEYPPLAKEEVAQVWLADPTSNDISIARYYDNSGIKIYWGGVNTSTDKPAIAVTNIYYTGTFLPQRFYYDSDSSRASTNGFTYQTCTNPSGVTTSMGTNRSFYCETTISGLNGMLVLLRIRFLYNNSSQPLAVQPLGGACGMPACSLPPQARLITSTGSAGDTQRSIQLFKLNQVVPNYFDYAIFSAGGINK